MKSKIVSFVLIIFLLVHCSRDLPNQTSIDKSAPNVVSTTPSSGAIGVSKFTEIIIDFSEQINPNNISQSSFQLTPPVPYSYAISGNRIIITPKGALPDGQKFWITVLNKVKDMAGNSMSENYSFTFRTAGHNSAQAQVTFKVDNSTGKNYNSVYICGSWDNYGDYDSTWYDGLRYAMYDDGQHSDEQPGDGIWGCVINLSVDLFHQYKFGIDDDTDINNGYIKDKSFFVLSSAAINQTVSLYPPLTVIFNYYDKENKVNSSIYLKGTFNDYANTLPMSGPSGSDRMFTVSVSLKEGSYTYKYYVDNDWDKVNQNDRYITVVYPATIQQDDYYQGGSPVIFNYYDVENKVSGSIYLKGDMNGWGDGNLMTGPTGPNRKFTTSVNAVVGSTYSYKYYVDGDWEKVNTDNRSVTIGSGQTEQNDYYSGQLNITFNYYDYEGKIDTSIHLRGDMNGWALSYEYQLSQDPLTNYKYTLTIPLSQGSYNYKYYVDNDYNEVNVNNRTVDISSTNSTVINDVYQGL